MEIINKKLDDLVEYDKNPRSNNEAVKYVMESIRQFGFKVPIVIDKDNVIVCGHTRYKASKKLKLNEVPCIIADDLTDEQIKAFRLADNKVSEKAEWDFDLLEGEIDDILDINMEDFGFDFPDDVVEKEKEKKPNERVRTNNAYNLDLVDGETDGYFEMPVIECDHFIPKKIKSFNYALSSKEKNFGIHFYIDDYQFERIWNNPLAYIDTLKEYQCVFSPDFSLYSDMPLPIKIWNVYRSRLVGQVLQQCGIKVIPTISWCEEKTFDFCFDGIPKGSIVSISTIGVKRDKEAFEVWKNGVNAMIDKIEPKTIIVYGGEVEFDYRGIKTVYFENENTERLKAVSK